MPKPRAAKPAAAPTSRFTDDDLYLFHQGSHFRAYDRFGAHLGEMDGKSGAHFAVWAPNARSVSVVGSFNDWKSKAHPMRARGESGVWETFIPGVAAGDSYKYHVASKLANYWADKADPFGRFAELAPRTASRVWDLAYTWSDAAWMHERGARHKLDQPLSIYEVHLGSWKRSAAEGNRHLTYRELAPLLVEHVCRLDFTHVQLLPILEHPFYGTWGYGVTGYFAPTSRYGTPQDLMFLIDELHRAGIGVLLDWVPSHFPSDEASLGFFDGTHLYEHMDPRQGRHPDWKTLLFNYGRPEVQSFLISSALFWLEKYHLDGIRVDAVASMLYLDYSRKEGEWVANQYGGKENLEAIAFLRRMNEAIYAHYPDVQSIAEESTSWPMVSKPAYIGGLGFGLKWDMGWMHDTLKYLAMDPIHRKFHHNLATFRQVYSDAENFVLPLSHDEVVHGKKSLLAKMPGDRWRQFANLRLLYAWMWAQNGKKLLFMGGELAQWREWDHESELGWDLLRQPAHAGVMELVQRLNGLYRAYPALHQRDCERGGFEWIDCQDSDQSVLAVLRRGREPDGDVAAVFNFTPIPRPSYRIGVPRAGEWVVLLNTDDPTFGGSGFTRAASFTAEAREQHGRPASLDLRLPPLGALFLRAGE